MEAINLNRGVTMDIVDFYLEDLKSKFYKIDPDKYHIQAFKTKNDWANGTYELIGKHEQGNPYNLDDDVLLKHGLRILLGVPRNYEGIKEYLKEHEIEGIVFYRGNGEMCKIKRSDFGFNWNNKEN